MHRDHKNASTSTSTSTSTSKKLLTLTAQTLRTLTDDQLDQVAGASVRQGTLTETGQG